MSCPVWYSSKEERVDYDRANASGSIIECENQTLGERVPLVGTPFSLNYRGDRQIGSGGNVHKNSPQAIGPSSGSTGRSGGMSG